MARKSNKTAHVLNLITKNKTNEEVHEHNEAAASFFDNNNKTDTSVVGVDLHEDGSISLKIKENLMKLTDESMEATSENSENTMDSLPYANEIKEPPILENVDTQEKSPADNVLNDLPEQHLNIEKAHLVNPTTDELPSAETPIDVTDLDSEKSILPHISTTYTETKENSEPLCVSDTPSSDNALKHCPDISCDKTGCANNVDYCYVNVLEEIVKDRAEEFLKKLGICTCPRCIADTTALALNNLPPKYIVANKEHIFPLLNFYSNHYSVSVTAQLTKACITVGNFPHH